VTDGTDAGDEREARARLGRDLLDAALLRGDFVLSSGARSDYYLDKYRFETRPDVLRRIARGLAGLVPDDVVRIAGTELGAVALATALALECDLPFVIVRKTAKPYSTERMIEGELEVGDRVVLVEDVVTSGAQAIKAARHLLEAGAEVDRIVAVVDREEGGRAAMAEAGFDLAALFTRTELGI
jgi:orotate phosphoribosyltransferase